MASSEDALRIWNCLTCRRRKVRCDRRWPCSQCSKAGLDCAFPSSGRVPTRRDEATRSSSTGRQQDLLTRLNRLESLLRQVGIPPDDSPLPGDDVGLQASARQQREDEDTLVQSLGSLFVSEDDSVYIPSRFWRHISDEFTDIRHSFEVERQQSRSCEDGGPTLQGMPWAPFPAQHSVSFDVANYQPLPSQMAFIWQTYCENVDQSIKILHSKSIDKVIRESKGRLSSLPVSLQALLFAVSLAAISSMSEQDVVDNFRDTRTALVDRLSTGAEVSLAKADVLNTTDIRVLQALVIYVEVKSHESGTRASWCLTGLVVRIALLMGLHRDGSHFKNISPFNAEMRRRLWWHICFLDARSGESQAACTQLSIFSIFQDTEPPTNVNDEDFGPNDESPPTPCDGISDASLAIIRYHFWHLSKREKPTWSPLPTTTITQPVDSISAEAADALATTRQKIEDGFLRHATQGNPRHEFLSDMVRHALAKSELNFHLHDVPPMTSPLSVASYHCLDRIFLLCQTVLELSYKPEMLPATSGWYWALRPPVPWRYLNMLLVQLRRRPWGPTCERAWMCVNTYLTSSAAFRANYKKDILWLPTRQLLADVTEHREREHKRIQGDSGLAQQLQNPQNPNVSRGSDGLYPPGGRSATFDMAAGETQLILETQTSEGDASAAWLLRGSDDVAGLSVCDPDPLMVDSIASGELHSEALAFEEDRGWEEFVVDSTYADSAEAWQVWDQMMAL